ncbi:hypothetical protein [Rhodococcus sp. 11-3]|uniref:hypothetical protein n=1 Tax=Rhodococcus sp. 11-3 TaxID=2854796 RepID=UPI00203E7F61|nr:hypothetical protein [Rhodococcus sp. 11-3]USC16993.1 hypothetical protein KZJ41_09065 [Rhodococcus sp. 11-3]
MTTWVIPWTRIANKMRKLSGYVPGDYEDANKYDEVADLEDASLLTSEVRPGVHVVAIDLDLPAALVPSTTPGHYHLYIDHELSWEQYELLLLRLADVGIVERGYVNASIDRKSTHVRTPWTKKTKGDKDIVKEAESVSATG